MSMSTRMTAMTDSRLSNLVLVERDGPRALWRKPLLAVFTATCDDCNTARPFNHRVDAQDWLDGHDCWGRS